MHPRSLLVLLGLTTLATASAWWAASGPQVDPTPIASRPQRLISVCQIAVVAKLRGNAFIQVDEGVKPGDGYIYFHWYQNRRLAGIQARLQVLPGAYPPLDGEVRGKYVVVGSVRYGDQPLTAPGSEHRTYECEVKANEDSFAVNRVTLRTVK